MAKAGISMKNAKVRLVQQSGRKIEVDSWYKELTVFGWMTIVVYTPKSLGMYDGSDKVMEEQRVALWIEDKQLGSFILGTRFINGT